MKVSDFLGKKVIDKKALELGKVSDMEIIPQEGLIESITIAKGDFSFTKNDFEIGIDDIDKVGDYVLLKVELAELEIRAESASKSE
jgi:sporulation protein YlmC with PRC-barrel domain